jgi:glyoxylase-like metal-dependent hydrolase (beta-lactamase superfamily II)
MASYPRQLTEIADRVWVVHHEWMELNITVVAGERGLAVVDTLGSGVAAAGLVEDLRGLPYAERGLVAAINTHEHWDHVFGNATLRAAWPDVTLHAQEEAAARTLEAGERVKGYFRDQQDSPERDPFTDDVLATEILPAETTFSSVGVVDLGDRVLELMHPGRGHTGGDIVVRIGDVDVVVFGDLVEEAGPPAFGPDSFPLEWAASLDTAIGLTTEQTTVVPGHGAVVPRSFVTDQRGDITAVAENIRAAAAQGLSVEETLRDAEWPFPADALEDAVRRGFAQLPTAVTPGSARQLPLA